MTQPTMSVSYRREPHLSPDEFIDLLHRSTLGERGPVENREIIQGMIAHANVIFTARVQGRLVGVSRAITDYSVCTYLPDLAVDVAFQRQGIGPELVRQTHEAAGFHTALILSAPPDVESYHQHIGTNHGSSCWVIPRRNGSL